MDKNVRTAIWVFKTLLVVISGVLLISESWKVALGVFLFIWANNFDFQRKDK